MVKFNGKGFIYDNYRYIFNKFVFREVNGSFVSDVYFIKIHEDIDIDFKEIIHYTLDKNDTKKLYKDKKILKVVYENLINYLGIKKKDLTLQEEINDEIKKDKTDED